MPSRLQVWQALLSVRSLVLPPAQDVHTYLKFSSLCRKSGRVRCGFVHWHCRTVVAAVIC